MKRIESQLAKYPPNIKSDILKSFRTKPINGEKVQQEEFLAGVVEQALVSNVKPDTSFWNSVHLLSNIAIKQKTSKYIDLFVQLFENAKQISNEAERRKYIYLTGKYIYRLKQVRMDPVNEVEFMDSLVAFRRPFVALKLWESRAGREDINGFEDFWSEVGVLYHLDAGLLLRANKMAMEMSNPSPKVAAYLLSAFALRLRKNRCVDEKSSMQHWFNKVKNGNGEFADIAVLPLIAAKQFEWAAELIPNLDSIDTKRFVRAFGASVNAKCEGQNFMPLYEALVKQSPELATNPVVLGILALNSDQETASAVLDEIKERKLIIPKKLEKLLNST